eukprot:TRINITY_DN2185_c0_g1_i12.p1 TRINITY_DN2185_c0_g1~~TRINITY_DN2185_c0_g1_i12.p1  ORF type:complete len:239 (+),score=52.93 TRINITY_DN2185_c0_g1_i12:375-1091(+)
MLNSKLWDSASKIQQCKENSMFIPSEYNFFHKFPTCINPIQSQGLNSTAYALIASSMVSDRVCRKTQERVAMSAKYLVSCSPKLNTSIGNVADAVELIASGSVPLAECFPNSRNICSHGCDRNVSGKTIKGVCKTAGEDNIKREILASGPVAGSVRMESDFATYRQGVYQYRPGAGVYSITGEHLVKIIGWGEVDGVKYWQIENTWGSDWGEEGYGKIEISQSDGIVQNEVLAVEIES